MHTDRRREKAGTECTQTAEEKKAGTECTPKTDIELNYCKNRNRKAKS